ncbi:MAG: hypothetical protein AAF907_08735, partial [Planctomycetota bacterium]
KRLAPFLEPLCGPEDAVAVPGDWVENSDRFERVEPWGVEPQVLGWLGLIGVQDNVLQTLPNPAAVRPVNGRRWQLETERVLEVSDRVVLCLKSDEVFRSVAQWEIAGHEAVIKGEYGGSGRSVWFSNGVRQPNFNTEKDCYTLKTGCSFTVEPAEDADAEISAHLTVTDDGVTFDGLCSLVSSMTGQFVSVEPLADPPAALLEPRPIWEAVAERARADGYRGYLGIDAAVKDGVVIRPIRDVNARWTMGRIALTLGREVRNP